MKSEIALLVFLAVCSSPLKSLASEKWFTGTVKWVYPQSDGNIVVGFFEDNANCTNASRPDKYHAISLGLNGVTLDGRKNMFSSLLIAKVTKATVTIAFEAGNQACAINRLVLN